MMADRLSALTRELDESRREVAARRHELDSARGASAVSLTDLVRGVHAVDEAESLTAVLHRLIEAAQQHSRARPSCSCATRACGNGRATDSTGACAISERGMSVASNAALERRRVESESAIAFPVSVGGEVIAVLYAEVDDALSPQRRMSKDALDTLTRHAGRVLETITVQQAAGLRPLRRYRRPVAPDIHWESGCREAGAGGSRAGDPLCDRHPRPGRPPSDAPHSRADAWRRRSPGANVASAASGTAIPILVRPRRGALAGNGAA